MLSRIRFAWHELWGSEDTVELYTRARHAAQLRILADPRPQPDTKLIQRIIEGRHHKLGTVERIRRSGW